MKSFVFINALCCIMAAVYACHSGRSGHLGASDVTLPPNFHVTKSQYGKRALELLKPALLQLPYYDKDFQMETEDKRKVINYLPYFYLNSDRMNEA